MLWNEGDWLLGTVNAQQKIIYSSTMSWDVLAMIDPWLAQIRDGIEGDDKWHPAKIYACPSEYL